MRMSQTTSFFFAFFVVAPFAAWILEIPLVDFWRSLGLSVFAASYFEDIRKSRKLKNQDTPISEDGSNPKQ